MVMINYIEESKVVFETYSNLSSLDICSCCLARIYEKELRTANRFKISSKALYEYNTSAKSGYTLETASELKYFIPRLLELT